MREVTGSDGLELALDKGVYLVNTLHHKANIPGVQMLLLSKYSNDCVMSDLTVSFDQTFYQLIDWQEAGEDSEP